MLQETGKRRGLAIGLLVLSLILPLLIHGAVLPTRAGEPLKGVALVIGQSSYKSLPALPNPERDARAIEDLLAKLGFETDIAADANLKKLRRSIDGFIDDAQGADVALLYYSGHGIEAGGVNYLIPIDAGTASLQAADEGLVPLQDVLERLRSKARIIILLLDACRSNPFPKDAVVRRSAQASPQPIAGQGLGAPRGALVIDNAAPADTIGAVIGFAAEPGQAALDGAAGGNSPYAAALLKHLGANQRYDFGQVMTMVTEEVYLATGTRQRPWTNASLRRFLSFGGAADETSPDEAALAGARRSLLLSIAATPDDMRKAVEGLARDQALPLDPLYGMLKELQVDTTAGPEELDRQLRIGAENLKKLIADKVVALRKDPELARLASLADRAQAEGALALAKDYRLKASARADELDKTLDQREADMTADRIELAAAYADAGDTAALAFDFRAASDQYAKAYRQVEGRDAALAFKYRLQEIAARASLGGYKGDKDIQKSAIALFDEMADGMSRERTPSEWAAVQNAKGGALLALGEQEPGTGVDALVKANIAFANALEVWSYAQDPVGWAAVQNNIGNVLRLMGERKGDLASFEKSIAAHEAALTVLTRERTPLEWAFVQANLGMALINLGMIGKRQDALLRATTAFEASLTVRSRQESPFNWAASQTGLGLALLTLGIRENDPEKVTRALSIFKATLTVFTRESTPIAWSTGQSNLGDAFMFIADRESGTVALRDAIAAYEGALEIRKRELYPLYWAPTAYQYARALEEMDRREPRPDLLPQVIATYEAVLTVWTARRIGESRIGALSNLARAYVRLAEREQGDTSLTKAISLHETALREISRAREPVDWSANQIGLGMALKALGEREHKPSRMPQAIAAFEAGLAVMRWDEEPELWAMTQYYLGTAHAFAGRAETGTRSLISASAAFEKALGIFTSNTSPDRWALVAYDHATLLQAMDQRERQDGLLVRAAKLYEALLPVWTREKRPNEWLKVVDGLGNALGKLGERQDDVEMLTVALALHETALSAISASNAPLYWAQMETRSGVIKFHLGKSKRDRPLLSSSRRSLEAAQNVYRAANEKRFDPLILGLLDEISTELRKTVPGSN